MKRLPLILGLMLLLAACEKDIEFDGKETDPLMVVNAIIPQDSLFEVKLTESRFFMHYADTFETVKNATVVLYVNGMLSDTLVHAGNGRYISGYRVKRGDLVRIVAQAPPLNPVTTDMRIVPATEVVRLDTTVTRFTKNLILDARYDKSKKEYLIDTVGWACSFTLQCKLTFSDTPDNDNYYRLVVFNKQHVDSIHIKTNQLWYKRTDVVFGEKEQSESGAFDTESRNKYGIFTNELFKGRNYVLTFSFDVNYTHFKGETVIRKFDPWIIAEHKGIPGIINYYIDLQTISKDYYLYLATTSNYNPDDLFAESVQIHSNVVGGTGIVANYSHQLIPVKLPL